MFDDLRVGQIVRFPDKWKKEKEKDSAPLMALVLSDWGDGWWLMAPVTADAPQEKGAYALLAPVGEAATVQAWCAFSAHEEVLDEVDVAGEASAADVRNAHEVFRCLFMGIDDLSDELRERCCWKDDADYEQFTRHTVPLIEQWSKVQEACIGIEEGGGL